MLTRAGEISLRWLVTFLLCAAFHAAAAQTADRDGGAPAAAARHPGDAVLARAHSGDRIPFRVLRGPDGRATHVSGEFATSVQHASGAVVRESVERAAREFIGGNLAALGLPADSDVATSLVFDDLEEGREDLIALRGHQVWNGLPVRGSDFVFVLRTSGDLVSFTGSLRPPRRVAAPRFEVADALEALSKHTNVKGTLMREGAPGQRWRVPEAGLALRVEVDPDRGRVVWAAADGRTRFVVDPLTRAVETTSRVDDASSTAYRQVRARDYDNTNWRQGPVGTAANFAANFTSGVWKNEFSPGACEYRLQWGWPEYSGGNGIRPWVADWDSGELYILGSCTTALNDNACPFSFQCPDTDGDGSFYRQQHNYYWLRRGLMTASTRVFNVVPGAATHDVGLMIDVPNGAECNAGAAGCFHVGGAGPGSPNIYVVGAGAGADILWHEMGHFVVWAYGDLNNNCHIGDESDPLDEGIADVTANLVALDVFSGIRYRDARGPRHTPSRRSSTFRPRSSPAQPSIPRALPTTPCPEPSRRRSGRSPSTPTARAGRTIPRCRTARST